MTLVTAEERAQWNARHQENAPDHIEFGRHFGNIKDAQAVLAKLYAFPGRWHEMAEQMYIIANAAADAAACAAREAKRFSEEEAARENGGT